MAYVRIDGVMVQRFAKVRTGSGPWKRLQEHTTAADEPEGQLADNAGNPLTDTDSNPLTG